MSMAAGEYVSVSSQSDTEQADMARERKELAEDGEHEHAELAAIYVGRGLDADLADRVAAQLMAKDALGSHAQEELGISDMTAARPLQAAATSAITFSLGAALPLAAALMTPSRWVVVVVTVTSLASLILLGWFGARAGGAPGWTAVRRVTFWGALAMGVTAGIGALIGHAV
jgi:VIT1/CCC1 family predicted Fe2+/Mn2+ transporter